MLRLTELERRIPKSGSARRVANPAFLKESTVVRSTHLLLGLMLGAGPLAAQQLVTRAEVVAAALSRGGRVQLARADTTAAAAGLRAARLYPNPSLAWSWSKDPPHQHLLADMPLDWPWLRAPRIGSASLARQAGLFGFGFERAAIRFEAETTYTHALAAAAQAQLSRRNAHDADSLLVMARVRHDVGDVSELDVRLAEVNAGQMENAAADDSLAAVEALLGVQLVMGLPALEPTIVLADTLAPPPDAVAAPAGQPLRIAAAAAGLASGQRALTFAHRNAFAAPSLQIGFDRDDPGPGGQKGLLPVIGFALPLPLFNQNGGEVAQARAARDRAQANLDLVSRESAAEQARVARAYRLAVARMERDRQVVAAADRVAAMSLQAYAEGAVPLANVLEAQRTGREALARYIADVAALADAVAASRLVNAVAES
jgi:cobalt-zinc-cadmium efflux system outer membrane protein